MKRRKKERQLEQEELKRKREEEEAKIDAWRAKLQQEEDTKRRVCHWCSLVKKLERDD